MANNEYKAESIQVFEGLEHVRKRPDMYIGDTEQKGLHHLIWEILDNSIDEISAGFGNKITVVIEEDGAITVEDDGRGIPVDKHAKHKMEAVRLVFEKLGAGGKFDNKTYKTSGGLHGVGASVVNALSTSLVAQVHRDGKIYQLNYINGKLKGGIKETGKTKRTGTTVRFYPDESIFSSIDFKHSIIKNRLQELAFLNSGVTIVFKDQRRNTENEFCYKTGLKAFIDYLSEGKKIVSNAIHFSREVDDVVLDVALRYTDDQVENVFSFVNNIPTHNGGKHDEGFRAALTRALNETIKLQNQEKKRGKNNISVQGSDATEGIICILSLRMGNPKFGGQTKNKLSNPEIKGTVMSIVYEELMKAFSKNDKIIKDIIERVSVSVKSRESAKAARDLQKKKKDLKSNPLFSSGKVANCTSKMAHESEIFIVEGDSAGGSAKAGRNIRTQAILPLKGKPLNVEKKRLIDILNNSELRELIQELGCGIGNEFDLEKLKYHKIIIMTDADVDGAHIRLILITFFYRYMRPLLEEGMLYIAMPPLYKVYNKKKMEYALTDKELDAAIKKVGRGYELQRYKGLGEMDAKQLWETTMNPINRTLIRLSIDDAVAIDKSLSIFMGTDVKPRKEYIDENL